MKLSAADKKKLLSSLERTSEAIEQIILVGLTAASETTHKTLAVTFQEASRLKLLRLGSTLRNAHDEISRFVKDDARFSQKRLMFFLHRCWIMCCGIRRAIEENDGEALSDLLWQPKTRSCEDLNVVCLGVLKKVAAGAFCAFEFRLRQLETGTPLTWSTVFPLKAGVEIPAEGFLHLPQKQKFTASVFLEKNVVTISRANLAESQFGPSRVQLLEDSEIESGATFKDWSSLSNWKPENALERASKHEVTPFDVDVELQEEVFFEEYVVQKPDGDDPDRLKYPLQYQQLDAMLVVSKSVEGEATALALKSATKRNANSGTLYGLMHYADAELVVQPLTFFKDGEPDYISISKKTIDRKALLQSLKFT